jgi:DNA invertase Pin-like site-specific DNA recombinase
MINRKRSISVRLSFEKMTRDQIKTVIGYVRVSTDEQASHGSGLDAQKRAIRDKVKYMRWHLLPAADGGEFFEDAGVSGKRMAKQPQLVVALAELRAGRAHALVVSKMDRLSRSLRDFAGLIETASHEGWHLVAIDLDIDTSTPGGEMAANNYINASQFERRMISTRTKEGLAARRARGIGVPHGLKGPIGRPPTVEGDLLKRILRRRRAGKSFASIADELTHSGIPTPTGAADWGWGTVAYAVRKHMKEPIKRRARSRRRAA